MRTKPGDWVRFYRDGNLVIGVVQYVLDNDIGLSSRGREVCTDNGSTGESYLLEVRPAHKGEG